MRFSQRIIDLKIRISRNRADNPAVTEALDLTTPSGRAFAGIQAAFA